jgi:hypothetical protein
MSEGTHRCGVEGCPNLAAYEVMHYSFDPVEGAVVYARDETCPYICVEHAIDNERTAHGGRAMNVVVAYPYTNRAQRPGISIYLQQLPAYVA